MAEVYGLPIKDLPEGTQILECYVLVKGLNADGEVRFWEYRTSGLNPMEALGMATTAADSMRIALHEGRLNL